MKFKSARIKGFKRFTDLTIQKIPDTARLIILAGPNGSGKSSFFDALYTWYTWKSRKQRSWESNYHAKIGRNDPGAWNDDVTRVEFYDNPNNTVSKKALYVRSAYRNDPQFRISGLHRQENPLDYLGISRMTDNDATVARNYQRLASKSMYDLYQGGNITFNEYLKQSIGEIKYPLLELFPDLQLNGLGNPLENGTFYFNKGTSIGFEFGNLSGGEKAAFDLILDFIII